MAGVLGGAGVICGLGWRCHISHPEPEITPADAILPAAVDRGLFNPP
ncbi:MAG: hypothetical protein ACRDSE_24920 [Pseudonocardiaceae bacterium]